VADRELDEYDVAVVVYGRSTGADRSDAEDRLHYAVQHALLAASDDDRGFPAHLPTPHPRVEINPRLVGVRRLSSAPVMLAPSTRPFSELGLGAPRKAADGG